MRNFSLLVVLVAAFCLAFTGGRAMAISDFGAASFCDKGDDGDDATRVLDCDKDHGDDGAQLDCDKDQDDDSAQLDCDKDHGDDGARLDCGEDHDNDDDG